MCPPLRSRTYMPPKDLQSRFESHVKEIFGSSAPSNWQDTSLGDGHLKFSFLSRLADDLGHAVPNSRLHEMCRVRDVLDFYNVPVQDRSKFDELIASNLPPNVKITWGYWAVQKTNTLKSFFSPKQSHRLSYLLMLCHVKYYQNCSLKSFVLWKNAFFFLLSSWIDNRIFFFHICSNFVLLMESGH